MRTRLDLVVGVAALGLVAAACGSSDEGGAAPRTSPSDLLPEAVSTPIGGGSFTGGISNGVVGAVTALSFYADASGGVGLLNIGRFTKPGATSYGTAKFTFHVNAPSTNKPIHDWITGSSRVTIPSIPNGLDGKPWTGTLKLRFGANGNAQAHLVQLKKLTGVNTLGDDDSDDAANPDEHDGKWIALTPSTTAVCITTNDCALEGLAASSTCTNDTCQANRCVGVVCATRDQCHPADGVCDPTTGACSNPPAADGTACNAGNLCTRGDTCQAGACIAGNLVVCTASDACHVAGTCDPATGVCSGNDVNPDGTACSGGTCQSGVCTTSSR